MILGQEQEVRCLSITNGKGTTAQDFKMFLKQQIAIF